MNILHGNKTLVFKFLFMLKLHFFSCTTHTDLISETPITNPLASVCSPKRFLHWELYITVWASAPSH